MDVTTFLIRFEYLPKKIQRQIVDLAENLIRQSVKKQRVFSFDWESTLNKDQSAVNLQHEANSWR